jgi:hypothetical protein
MNSASEISMDIGTRNFSAKNYNSTNFAVYLACTVHCKACTWYTILHIAEFLTDKKEGLGVLG